MPIVVDAELRQLSQAEFGGVAYDVMERAFEVRGELGRFFDESIYQEAIAIGLDNARTEVPIEVTFRDFRKTFFIDLLVDNGAVFEMKTVEKLNRGAPGAIVELSAAVRSIPRQAHQRPSRASRARVRQFPYRTY